MSAARPARKRSALNASPASVIAPVPAPGTASGAAGIVQASVASIAGCAGNAGEPGKEDPGERIVKVTARVDEDLAGRCRAAYIDGMLDTGIMSFEGWIAAAMAEKLARAEKRRGREYEPVGTGRVPRGRRN